MRRAGGPGRPSQGTAGAARSVDGATGAGINLLAGLIRLPRSRPGDRPRAGPGVRHQLPRITGTPRPRPTGTPRSRPCVPQGARVQLDPTIDVDSHPGITPAEVRSHRRCRPTAATCGTAAAVALGIAFEVPTGGEDPYPDAGLPGTTTTCRTSRGTACACSTSWDGG